MEKAGVRLSDTESILYPVFPGKLCQRFVVSSELVVASELVAASELVVLSELVVSSEMVCSWTFQILSRRCSFLLRRR